MLSSYKTNFATQFLQWNLHAAPWSQKLTSLFFDLLLLLIDCHIFLHDFAPRNCPFCFLKFATFVLIVKPFHLLTLVPGTPCQPCLPVLAAFHYSEYRSASFTWFESHGFSYCGTQARGVKSRTEFKSIIRVTKPRYFWKGYPLLHYTASLQPCPGPGHTIWYVHFALCTSQDTKQCQMRLMWTPPLGFETTVWCEL